MRRATLLAKQFRAGIALVHVVDDDQPRRMVDAERDEAEKLLRQMAATLRNVDGVECETCSILASPFVGIAQAVAKTAPDLLVIGPHRRQVLRDVFVGTTAERTIQSVECPVLMANAPPAGHYGHALQTTDLSDGSRDALQRFPALGIGERARNSLLYVFDAPALRLIMGHALPKEDREHYLADEQRDAARDLAGFVASAGFGEVRQLAPRSIGGAARDLEGGGRGTGGPDRHVDTWPEWTRQEPDRQRHGAGVTDFAGRCTCHTAVTR